MTRPIYNQGADNYYLYVAIIVIFILLLPAIILFILGYYFRKKKPKAAKVLFILAGIYLLVGLGYCGFIGI